MIAAWSPAAAFPTKWPPAIAQIDVTKSYPTVIAYVITDESAGWYLHLEKVKKLSCGFQMNLCNQLRKCGCRFGMA
jgi:hypothetical protein